MVLDNLLNIKFINNTVITDCRLLIDNGTSKKYIVNIENSDREYILQERYIRSDNNAYYNEIENKKNLIIDLKNDGVKICNIVDVIIIDDKQYEIYENYNGIALDIAKNKQLDTNLAMSDIGDNLYKLHYCTKPHSDYLINVKEMYTTIFKNGIKFIEDYKLNILQFGIDYNKLKRMLKRGLYFFKFGCYKDLVGVCHGELRNIRNIIVSVYDDKCALDKFVNLDALSIGFVPKDLAQLSIILNKTEFENIMNVYCKGLSKNKIKKLYKAIYVSKVVELLEELSYLENADTDRILNIYKSLQ